MRTVDHFIDAISNVVPEERCPFLHKIGARAASAYFKLQRYTVRRLGCAVDIRLSPEFRHVRGTYELEAMKMVCQLLRPGDTAVDVGANIGLYTLVMAKQVGPTGKVYAFEPANKSYETLIEHISLNGLQGVVDAHQLLIDRQKGTLLLHEDGLRGTNRVGGSRFDGPNTVVTERRSTTLDDFFMDKRQLPDLIKIDVEGYEFNVLMGAPQTLKKHSCTVLCEVHPPLLSELGVSFADMCGFMREVGYRMLDLQGKPLPGFLSDQNQAIVCVPSR